MTITHEPDTVGQQADRFVLLRPLAPTGLGVCWEAITPGGEHRRVEVLDLTLAARAGLDPQRLAGLIGLRHPVLAEPEAIIATPAGPGLLLHRLASSPFVADDVQTGIVPDLPSVHAYLRERGMTGATITDESLRQDADGLTRVLITAAWAAPATEDHSHTAPVPVEVNPASDPPRADSFVALRATTPPRETRDIETPAALGEPQPIPSAPRRRGDRRQFVGGLVVVLAFAVGIIAGEHRTSNTPAVPRTVTVPRPPALRPAIPPAEVADPPLTITPTPAPSPASVATQSPAPAPLTAGPTEARRTIGRSQPKPRKPAEPPTPIQARPPARTVGLPTPLPTAPVVTGRVHKPGGAAPATVATAAVPPPR